MAGKYADAIEHYQAALKMAPGFSIMGLADTYALQGEEERARAEYSRCNEHSEMSEDRILCRLQYPITYVWEKNYRAADEAFETTAKWAHEHDLGFAEAQAHRMMAMYQQDDAVALQHLDRAAAVLDEHASVSKSDHGEETARILRWRFVRAVRGRQERRGVECAAAIGNPGLLESKRDCAALLPRRAGSANSWRQGKAAEAIPHLREDVKDAFSMALLVKAYEQTGDQEMAATARTNWPTCTCPRLRMR